MQVFKTYFRISKEYIGTALVYTGIFLVIMLILTNNSSSNTPTDFKSSSVSIAIFDKDNSTLSNNLKKYLSSNNKLVEINEDLDTFRDNFYERELDYVLIINEGFELNALALADNNVSPSGDMTELKLEAYKLPGSYAATFVEMKIQKFISTYTSYIIGGYSGSEAYEHTMTCLDTSTEVTVGNNDNTDETMDQAYFRFLPYILISVIASSIAPILLQFNKTEIKKRTLCSSISPLKRNLALVLASLSYTLLISVFFLIVAILKYDIDMPQIALIYRILNVLLYSMLCLSASFFLAQIVSTYNTLNMIITIYGLAGSFLCGIFVSRDLLGSAVLAVGKFFPAYWYMNVELDLINYNGFNSTLLYGYLIQLLFTVAFFAVGTVVGNMNKQDITE